MFYFIYKTTNLENGKYYIGMHKTNNLSDGYLGSGTLLRRAVSKYGKEKFKREILEFCSNREELKEKEKEYVNENVISDENSYNLKLGGEGGFDYINNNSLNVTALTNARKKFLELIRTNPSFKEFWQRRLKESKTEELLSRISTSLKEKWKRDGHPWKGRKRSEETKRKIGRTNSANQTGEKNSQFGTCWISNPLIKKSIRIGKEQLYDYICEGWIKKRIIKWK